MTDGGVEFCVVVVVEVRMQPLASYPHLRVHHSLYTPVRVFVCGLPPALLSPDSLALAGIFSSSNRLIRLDGSHRCFPTFASAYDPFFPTVQCSHTVDTRVQILGFLASHGRTPNVSISWRPRTETDRFKLSPRRTSQVVFPANAPIYTLSIAVWQQSNSP